MGIFASETGPSFGYTIGLTETQKAPELIMFGLPIPLFGHFLNAMAEKMKAGERFKDGDIINDLANMPCVIRDIPLEQAKKYAFQAFFHYEGAEQQPTFQMIVIPDKNGKFPWDEGFDEEMRKSQPELWHVPQPAPVLPKGKCPSDYKHIAAWGRKMGSFAYYIKDQQDRAFAAGAPVNAIYEGCAPGGVRTGVWNTVDQCHPEVRDEVNAAVEAMEARK